MNEQKYLAEEYSFNTNSTLFYQLTEEQQKLWKQEIEQAFNDGMKNGKEQFLKKNLPKEISDSVTKIAEAASCTFEKGFSILTAAQTLYNKGKEDAKKAEEPKLKDLEAAADDYAHSTLVGSQFVKKNAFKTGANYQRQKDDIILAQKMEESFQRGYRVASKEITTKINKEYVRGALEERQRIIGDAVETKFNVSLPSTLYDKLYEKGFREDDKMLIIKK